ncbi:MAG: helix-turn-helix domain-containing protein [Thiotrichales bacterium]
MDRLHNSGAAQRKRLLEYLHAHNRITTLEARSKLDILMPATRVFELREQGEEIVTHWREDTTPEGNPHRVAEYVLMPGKKKAPTKKRGQKNSQKINTGGSADA